MAHKENPVNDGVFFMKKAKEIRTKLSMLSGLPQAERDGHTIGFFAKQNRVPKARRVSDNS